MKERDDTGGPRQDGDRGPGPARSHEVRDSSFRATLKSRLGAELHKRLHGLRAAVRLTHTREGRERIGREAHRLAGAAAYCGETELQESASALEAAARGAATDEIERLLRRLERSAARIGDGRGPQA